MTTPTDPTTLRTALEALHEATFDFISWLVASNWSPEDPDDLVPINVALSAARAVLATPAPAADEARCGFMWSVDGRACGRPEDDERHTEDAFLFHPFQPAPTPAPPTPPATEPVAALVERMVEDWADYEFAPSVAGRGDIEEWGPVIRSRLDAIVAAARAEVDVEALALALHDAHVECRFWYVDGARTESEFHHDHATRIIAALAARARRAGETADDR